MRKINPITYLIFLVIALILIVVGWKTEDYFWYIRAGIFCVGAGAVWFLNRWKINVKVFLNNKK